MRRRLAIHRDFRLSEWFGRRGLFAPQNSDIIRTKTRQAKENNMSHMSCEEQYFVPQLPWLCQLACFMMKIRGFLWIPGLQICPPAAPMAFLPFLADAGDTYFPVLGLSFRPRHDWSKRRAQISLAQGDTGPMQRCFNFSESQLMGHRFLAFS